MALPLLGYYGKLPLSPEFLRLNASGPEVRWLDDWLQRGVLYGKDREGARWPALVAESGLWNFMYVPEGPGRIVCGVLFASHDKAGRSFPFLTYLLIDRDLVSGKPWLIPLLAEEFLEFVTPVLQQLRQDLNWTQFNQRIEAFSGVPLNVEPVSTRLVAFLSETDTMQWWMGFQEALGCSSQSRFQQGLERLKRVLMQYEKGMSLRGLIVPLSAARDSGEYDLSVWLQVIKKTASHVQRQEPGMMVFWNRHPATGEPCALVSLGPGTSNVMRWVVAPRASDDSWCDVLQGGQPASQNSMDSEVRKASEHATSLQRMLEDLSERL